MIRYEEHVPFTGEKRDVYAVFVRKRRERPTLAQMG
jgi:hypothetical protein